MSLTLITPPTVEPVTLAEAKLHLRVETGVTDDDDLITALIVAAREAAEHITGRALITQTLERVLDAFPPAELELGRGPVQSVTSISYTDTAGDAQTVNLADVTLDADTNMRVGFVLPSAALGSWPSTYPAANVVRVRFVAGYGDAGSDVPAGLRAWIKLRVHTLYQQRSEIAAGVSIAAMPDRYTDRLLDPYRVWA